MASSWGQSWGTSWANSWGNVGEVIEQTGGGGASKLHRQRGDEASIAYQIYLARKRAEQKARERTAKESAKPEAIDVAVLAAELEQLRIAREEEEILILLLAA